MGHTAPASPTTRSSARLASPARELAKTHSLLSAQVLAQRIVCVPQHEISGRVADIVREFVDAERQEALGIVDSELVDRLGSSYILVAELVVQLMERQRTVARLSRQLHAAQRPPADDSVPMPRSSTPVNG